MNKKITTTLMIVLLIFSGCSSQESGADTMTTTASKETTTASPTTEVATTEAPAESTTSDNATSATPATAVMEAFNALLVPESTAADLGNFIRSNIHKTTPEQAETMIQWLIVYQTEPMDDVGNLFWEPEYMDALNMTMNGFLDPNSVGLIENEQVRSDYQGLIDGFMTIVRYEETPVIEMDWEALQAYSDYFSEDMNLAIDSYVRHRSTYREDYYEMGEEIIALEQRIDTMEDGFVRNQLREVHSILVSFLLIGPEGSHVGTFLHEDSYTEEIYNQLVALAADYPNSSFSQLIEELAATEWVDWMGPLSLSNDYISFGYGSSYRWQTTTETVNGINRESVALVSDRDPAIADITNKLIDNAVQSMLSTAGNPKDYGTYMYTTSFNDRLASVSISLNYSNISDDSTYLSDGFVIDLRTGQELTLAELLNVSEADVLNRINGLAETGYTIIPNFSLYTNGISLEPNPLDASDSPYRMLPLKDLVPYVDHELILQ